MLQCMEMLAQDVEPFPVDRPYKKFSSGVPSGEMLSWDSQTIGSTIINPPAYGEIF